MSNTPPTSTAETRADSTLDEPLHARRVRQVELLISTLLRVGVLLSLTIVLVGTISTFAHHREYLSSPQSSGPLLGPTAEFPHSIRQVVSGVREMQGRAIVVLGLLLLIATPVMRVAVSIVGFVYEHDPTYVVITSIVLALLLLSFVLGKATAG
jgi:uncharacterized membrane protein